MEITEIRKRNLAELIERHGGQARLAERVRTAPSYLSQLMSGHRTVGNTFARKIEKHLRLDRGWMDTLDHRGATSELRAMSGSHDVNYGNVLPWRNRHDLDGGKYEFIPRYEVQVSAGNGGSVFSELQDEVPQAFRVSWLEKRSLKPENLRCVYAQGDSMEETISDGATLLVDVSQTEVIDGKIYIIRYGDEPRVKRLFKRPKGLLIASDNDKYPEITLEGPETEGVEILGRVVWSASDH